MDQEIQVALDQLNARLAGRVPYKLAMARTGEIDYLEKNARYMTKEQFASLTRNIQADGALTSLPLCWRQPSGRLLVLSGNHRIKAAVEAGLEEFLVLVIAGELTEDRRLAIQLSHNAISGQDDEQILKYLWGKIGDLEASIYSGLSAETIEKLESTDFQVISEQRVLFKEVSLLFLPEEIETMESICEGIVEAAGKKAIFAGRITEYHDILEGIIVAKQEQKIINSALAFFALAQAVREYLDGRASIQEALQDGAGDTVFFALGATRKRIKKETAKALRKALKDKADAGLDLDAALLSLIQ